MRFRFLLIALLFLALASDVAARKPYRMFLPVVATPAGVLCGYYEPLDRWWCFNG